MYPRAASPQGSPRRAPYVLVAATCAAFLRVDRGLPRERTLEARGLTWFGLRRRSALLGDGEQVTLSERPQDQARAGLVHTRRQLGRAREQG